MPASKDMPSTLERSPKHAQEIWAAAHDSAVESYGEGRRAHQTAFAALKHSYEKVGDHWEQKEHRGPSDRNAARGRGGRTAEGVDANASVAHLREVAARLGIRGRTRMDKGELVDAIKKENRSRTREARER